MTMTTEQIAQASADLLAKVPDDQKAAAGALLAQYTPAIFEMAKTDILAFLMRLKSGDVEALAELDSKLSTDEWLAKVKANTARWENVAQYNIVRDQMKNEILLRLAPIVVTILAALVGL